MTNAFSITRGTLHCRAQLSFAGARCDLATNSPQLVSALQRWHCGHEGDRPATFEFNAMVTGAQQDLRRRPLFRGLHHIVIATFDRWNVLVFDLLRRTVNCVVTSAVARDTEFWEETVLPLIVGVMGATIAVLPVHCACLSIDGQGLLIAGVSGSGKSTLSVALAEEGLDFLSDDWTYITNVHDRLSAHGISAPVKLLPDAVQHFRFLACRQVKESLNGELAYELHPVREMGLKVVLTCEPRWIVFPERSGSSQSELIPLSVGHALTYLQSSVERLPSQLVNAERERARLITKLGEIPAWRFRYGGPPEFAARELQRLLPTRRGGSA